MDGVMELLSTWQWIGLAIGAFALYVFLVSRSQPNVRSATLQFLHTQRGIMKHYGHMTFDRPMDAMKVKFDSPQEDEFALASLGQLSPYLFMVFPGSIDRYIKYATMTTEEGVTEDERTRWKKLFVDFLKKVAFNAPEKTVLLKSPVHTGRIKIILEVFPDARFIHLHRNPYEVFQSTRHLFRTLFSHFNLQPVDYESTDAVIFRHYSQLYDAYLVDKALIPKGNLVELSFNDFKNHMVDDLAAIYSSLRITGWDRVRPIYEEACQKRQQHQQNKFKELSPAERQVVYQKWEKYFAAFGYTK